MEIFESEDQSEDLKNGDSKNACFPHVSSENKYFKRGGAV